MVGNGLTFVRRCHPSVPCGDSSVFALRAAASAAVALRHAAAAAALKGEPVFLASRGLPPLRGEVGEQSEPGGVVCADLPAVRFTPQSPHGDSSVFALRAAASAAVALRHAAAAAALKGEPVC